ncbi:MAG: N-acetylglucosamine-6-phosphate deacetylase [Clostridia bacterium]|nr:N-acetylglucosamine-6-phosphate deacetylase [Clostridia bacterium]
MKTLAINNALVDNKLKTILIQDGKIASIQENAVADGIDAGGKRVVPGVIDVHAHGCIGLDTMDADFEKMCAFLASKGTTSWLPTTMTMDADSLRRVTTAKTDFPGTQILGFHLEGPYISTKFKGAQNEAYIKNPDIEEFNTIPNVKMITLAPELDGAMEFIKKADCVTVLGHTACDYETAIKAIDAGANCLTHTFNAMPGLHHRNPGPIGAAVEKHIYAQVISDGLHVAKPVIIAAYKMFGPDRMTLISDSIRPAGLPDGVYESGGLDVYLNDGVARLKDGTIAGSSATLWQCVKKAVEFGIPFEDAVRMATRTPAEMLGVNKGRVEQGYDADLLIIDDNMDIQTVIIAGEVFKG